MARTVRRGLPPSFDIADLEQEARLEMWKQVQRFDAGRGVPFQGAAWAAVHGAVVMACRRRQYRDATHEELKGQYVDARPRPDQVLLDREQRHNVECQQLAKVRAVIAALPPVEAHLVRRVYLEGADLKELETLWGTRLDRRLKAAVRMLKHALLP